MQRKLQEKAIAFASSQPVQRVPMSQGNMRDASFTLMKGERWQRNFSGGIHASAIRLNGTSQVTHFHVVKETTGKKRTRFDYNEDRKGRWAFGGMPQYHSDHSSEELVASASTVASAFGSRLKVEAAPVIPAPEPEPEAEPEVAEPAPEAAEATTATTAATTSNALAIPDAAV